DRGQVLSPGASTMKIEPTIVLLASTGTDPRFAPFRTGSKMAGPGELTFKMEADPERDGSYEEVGEGSFHRVKGTAK
ncbi:MAG TPA: hypothetical protein VKF62_01280, partial [Planctomycetota bacterium]|nr:hypothetical protein [Planctomycetota bacterium]